ncbi:hypothetical protein X975_04165, partial [Stegodyphus mimosarum]
MAAKLGYPRPPRPPAGIPRRNRRHTLANVLRSSGRLVKTVDARCYSEKRKTVK